jgi:arginyl-tRNA synthetase
MSEEDAPAPGLPAADIDYALERSRAEVHRLLATVGLTVPVAEIRDSEGEAAADIAVPLFRIAKDGRRNPVQLAEELADRLDLADTGLAEVTALRGYLNFRLDPAAFNREVVADYRRDPAGWGRSTEGRNRPVVIDYSSPNIAKPFSVGHLRSTIIGQALHNILAWRGWRPVGDNHLGDWGTQFGKLLCAFERWGSEEELDRAATGHLLQLYVRFHDEAKTNPDLERHARDWFRRLEAGDDEARRRWRRFAEISRAEFDRIYDLLGVEIDHALGESFYEDRLQPLVERALAAGIARHEKPEATAGTGEDGVNPDETVVLIPLAEHGIATPLILQKSDGTSLYATRELATAEYRIERWHPARLLYVVGNEQELYFRQFAVALRLLGHDVPVTHVNFGLIRLPEGRLSTRAGRVILLEDVMREAVTRARAVVADRDMPEAEKDELARIVGVGALKYADLSQSRVKEVVFDWNRMLALDGDSAPYLQYAHTRCRSILRKAGAPPGEFDPAVLARPEEAALIRRLARFPQAVGAAARSFEPHRIANHVYRTAQDFSTFYAAAPVLGAETPELRSARLFLVEMTAATIRTGLRLLGIGAPERM